MICGCTREYLEQQVIGDLEGIALAEFDGPDLGFRLFGVIKEQVDQLDQFLHVLFVLGAQNDHAQFLQRLDESLQAGRLDIGINLELALSRRALWLSGHLRPTPANFNTSALGRLGRSVTQLFWAGLGHHRVEIIQAVFLRIVQYSGLRVVHDPLFKKTWPRPLQAAAALTAAAAALATAAGTTSTGATAALTAAGTAAAEAAAGTATRADAGHASASAAAEATGTTTEATGTTTEATSTSAETATALAAETATTGAAEAAATGAAEAARATLGGHVGLLALNRIQGTLHDHRIHVDDGHDFDARRGVLGGFFHLIDEVHNVLFHHCIAAKNNAVGAFVHTDRQCRALRAGHATSRSHLAILGEYRTTAWRHNGSGTLAGGHVEFVDINLVDEVRDLRGDRVLQSNCRPRLYDGVPFGRLVDCPVEQIVDDHGVKRAGPKEQRIGVGVGHHADALLAFAAAATGHAAAADLANGTGIAANALQEAAHGIAASATASANAATATAGRAAEAATAATLAALATTTAARTAKSGAATALAAATTAATALGHAVKQVVEHGSGHLGVGRPQLDDHEITGSGARGKHADQFSHDGHGFLVLGVDDELIAGRGQNDRLTRASRLAFGGLFGRFLFLGIRLVNEVAVVALIGPRLLAFIGRGFIRRGFVLIRRGFVGLFGLGFFRTLKRVFDEIVRNDHLHGVFRPDLLVHLLQVPGQRGLRHPYRD